MRLIDADDLKKWIMEVPIKDMETAIDNATTIGGWISVEDRLPEKGEIVLALVKATNPSYGQYHVIAALQNDGLWDSWDEEFCISGDPITHWMPLPEPPKEESNDD